MVPENKPVQDSSIRITQMKRTLSKKLLRDIFINMVFLYVLYSAFYSDRNENIYNYNKHIKSTFNQYQNVNNIFCSFSERPKKNIKQFSSITKSLF